MNPIKTDFLIIGGGVAGLSAANHLIDLGGEVTLLEGGVYPAEKICGEFLSPEAIPILEQWEIATTARISTMKLIVPNQELSINLPRESATIRRYHFDAALADRIEKKGGIVRTSARVENIQVPKIEGGEYLIRLHTGETYSTRNLLLSTGRIPTGLVEQTRTPFRYVGAKCHFSGIDLGNELVMHLIGGAYFGMAPIGPDRINVAGIITCDSDSGMNPRDLLNQFFNRPEAKRLVDQLALGQSLFDDWMVTPVPEFGIKSDPRLPNVYLLGDAAGVIPPATGNGLAMGLGSGILAAEFAIRGDDIGYRNAWKKIYRGRIQRGKLLHSLFLSKHMIRVIPILTRLIPSLPNHIFSATRG
jgi:flavin-dependent dehydrogenase